MAVEGGLKCIKYIMFLFNLILAVIGLILIIAGALALSKFGDYVRFIPEGEGSGVAYFIIAVGAIVFVIGFFGCCGAYKENTCFLYIFAGFLVLIFVFEVAAVVYGVVQKDNVGDALHKQMLEKLQKYGENDLDTSTWNNTQKGLSCCGVDRYTDYDNTTWFRDNGGQYPTSCCRGEEKVVGCGRKPDNLQKEGCYNAVIDVLKASLEVIVIICAVVAFIQVLAIICSCCLISGIRKNYEHV